MGAEGNTKGSPNGQPRARLSASAGMALSPRMLALIKKIEDADAAHFAALRETAKQEAAERARKRAARKKPSREGRAFR